MPRIYTRRPLADRLWEKVDKSGDCWLWTGRNSEGYGSISIGGKGGKGIPVHRAAYELLIGPIPEGLQIDHLCRNHSCVNPAHLEPVTNRENTLRGLRGRMVTHCAQGHEYTEANTIHRTNGRRGCRECNRIHGRKKMDAAYWRAYRAKRRAQGRVVGSKSQ